MSPFNAWVMLKGLETLPLRVAQQTKSASLIADFLAEQNQLLECSIHSAKTILKLT